MNFIGISLAIGITGAAVALGESWIGKTAMDSLSRQPEIEGKIRMLMLIAMAFVETAVLFGFVISILLFTKL